MVEKLCNSKMRIETVRKVPNFSTWGEFLLFSPTFFFFVSPSCGFHFAQRSFPRCYIFLFFLLVMFFVAYRRKIWIKLGLMNCQQTWRGYLFSKSVLEVLLVTPVFFIGVLCFTFNPKVHVITPLIISQTIFQEVGAANCLLWWALSIVK